MKVYTRTGDDGSTGLFYGGRASKSDIGPEAYGTVDEIVSGLGLARAERTRGDELHDLLERLQRELFVVGAELATAPEQRHKLADGTTRTTAAMVEALEPIIDSVTDRFEAPTEFVLPGQDRTSAALDLARTITRRAERTCVQATQVGWLEARSAVVPYLNRLADLLWVLARFVEGESVPLHER